MLLQRVITAVVLLIIIIGALLISPLAFTAVAAIAIGCCFWSGSGFVNGTTGSQWFAALFWGHPFSS